MGFVAMLDALPLRGSKHALLLDVRQAPPLSAASSSASVATPRRRIPKQSLAPFVAPSRRTALRELYFGSGQNLITLFE
jgi:hypothetical protein